MGKIRGPIERVDIPTVLAASVVQALLFPQHIVIGP